MTLDLVHFIKSAKKTTPVKVYVKGKLASIDNNQVKIFGSSGFYVLYGDWHDVNLILETNKDMIEDYLIENNCRNSAVPLLDLTNVNARIEPGAIIRDKVTIGANAVIMMGAIINIGASIGEETMIDMNAVIGARGIIGKRCHIGAGAVIAGVLEPPSKTPVIIEDDVLIGANAVILEGVRVGKGAVVGAGSVVTKDVPPYTLVIGVPAKVVKEVDEGIQEKTQIIPDLRK